jgi:hypothetical protein
VSQLCVRVMCVDCTCQVEHAWCLLDKIVGAHHSAGISIAEGLFQIALIHIACMCCFSGPDHALPLNHVSVQESLRPCMTSGDVAGQ